jgi:hypothetical protein
VSDTHPAMVREHHERLLARSGVERLRMCFAMFDLARSLALAGLGAGHGDDLRERLFLRMYGRDFSADETEQILIRLRVKIRGQ